MTSLDEFLGRSEDGSFYVGHATVLARLSGKLILIDPVLDRPLFLDSWLFFPPLALSDRLFEVDAVMISHCHEDHYDPNFLRRLKPGTPIYITEGCTGLDLIDDDQSFNTRRLKRDAFSQIFDDVQAYAIPSDHNSFDSSFIVKGNSFSLFQGNDNFVSREVMERAASASGPVDHAYIPYSYVWWYPFCLTSMSEAERKVEADRLTGRNMDIGRMMAEVLNAKHVIPSAGNLVLCDHANSAVNRGIATPFDYKVDAVETDSSSSGERVRVLVAGDYIVEYEERSEIVAQGYSKDEYFERMDAFLTDFNARNPAAQRTVPIRDGELESVRQRVSAFPPLEDNHLLYLRRDDRPSDIVEIDVNARSAWCVDQPSTEGDILIFDLQGPPFEQWLSGEISFETVLNSQRFSVFRRPERFHEPLWHLMRNYL
ncbi:MAG: MBL fold metallo-hydrolase [Sphingomicrobium sp.]